MTRILTIIALLFATPALSHGGRTNAKGCHNERATGGYQFADEIELSHKIEKVVDGVTQELFAILTQEEDGVMINEDVFAKRLLDKLHEEPA